MGSDPDAGSDAGADAGAPTGSFTITLVDRQVSIGSCWCGGLVPASEPCPEQCLPGLLRTDEYASSAPATFTVQLDSQPTADVTVALSSSDLTEGTVSPASLTFTAANWNIAQTVTVQGVNDVIVDGYQGYSIVLAPAVSSDFNYAGVDPPDVSLWNFDWTDGGSTVSPVSGLETTEAGGTATFTVVLQSQPLSNVTISIASSNTGEGTVSPAALTFNASNWNFPHLVTVAGVDDAAQDGDQPYTIETGNMVTDDSYYSGQFVNDVSVTNLDDD